MNYNLSQLKKDLFGADDDDEEESQESKGSVTGPHSLKKAPIAARKPLLKKLADKQTPLLAAVSVFEGESFVDTHLKQCLQNMWKGLREKIANVPIESIASYKSHAFYVLDEMKSFKRFDVSIIEELLKDLFDKAAAYDKMRSKSSEKASKDLLARQLKEAKDHLSDVKTRKGKETEQLKASKAELEQIREEFKEKEKNMSASIHQQEQHLHNTETEIDEIEEEIAAINNTSPLDDDLIEELKTSKLNLEATRDELNNLNPFV